MDYTNIEKIEEYLVKDIDPSDESKVLSWIRAISRHIDKTCKRIICKEPTDSDEMLETFTYDGDNTDVLIIDDCNSISVVTMDGNPIPDTAYVAYPQNKPWKSRILLKDGLKFNKGIGNIAVTAIQAMHKELPEDIQFACTVIVGGICNNQIFKEEGTSERIGNYQITYNDSQKSDIALAKQILATYTRISLA